MCEAKLNLPVVGKHKPGLQLWFPAERHTAATPNTTEQTWKQELKNNANSDIFSFIFVQ